MSEDKYVRGFYHLSEAWYGPANLRHSEIVDRIGIGIYNVTGGGTPGEFSIEWHNLGGGGVCPRLQVFGSTWKIFYESFHDLAKALATLGHNATPAEIAKLLRDELGVEDLTPRDRPERDGGQPPTHCECCGQRIPEKKS
jgi:hypothetical protein